MDPLSLIPHRPPFVLVDRVEIADATARGRALVTAGAARGPDGTLPQALVIEALAQTAAAAMGARARRAGATPGRGYLVEIRGFTLGPPPRAGDTLALIATHVAALGSLHRFRVEAAVGDEVIAAGLLTFAVEEEP